MPPAARQSPAQVAALQLHVSLNDIEPPIWRRFWVEETITLGRLHEVLQIVMGWDTRQRQLNPMAHGPPAAAERSEQPGIETEGFVPEDPHPVHLWMAWIEQHIAFNRHHR